MNVSRPRPADSQVASYMKNIMVIDGAENCVYDVFEAADDVFALIFAPGPTLRSSKTSNRVQARTMS